MARSKSIARTSTTTATNDDRSGGGHIPSGKVGMISDVKNLYEGKPDSRGRSTWVDKYPDDLEEVAENAETARYALLVRNKKSYDGRKKLEMDSVIVQSPLLNKALGPVLDDYPGVTTSLDRLTFKAPSSRWCIDGPILSQLSKRRRMPTPSLISTCSVGP